jgi:hypothetical protein
MLIPNATGVLAASLVPRIFHCPNSAIQSISPACSEKAQQVGRKVFNGISCLHLRHLLLSSDFLTLFFKVSLHLLKVQMQITSASLTARKELHFAVRLEVDRSSRF